jgi:uncharacterized membrane protein YkoI
MQHRVLQSVLVVVLIVGAGGCSGLRQEGVKGEKAAKKEAAAAQVSLSQVPEPARSRIEQLTTGGKIKKIEKAQEDGKTVYDVEATVQGRDMEYDVGADGTVLTTGQSIPFAALPIAVRAASEQYFGLTPVLKASVEVEGDKTFYEVEGKKGKALITLKLSDTGQILEEEKN